MSYSQPPARAGCSKDHGWTDLVEVGADADITITEDGRVLHGSDWITPSDYDDDDTQHNRLPMLKGCTPSEWPTLDGDQVDQVDDA